MSRPPTSGPSAVENPIAAPKIAKAVPRVRPGNINWIRAVTGGKKMPPARPCATRATTSVVVSSDIPAARLATVNPASPTMKTHR